MTKLQALKVTNVLLLISFVAQALTSVLLFFSIRNELIEELHEYNGLFFLFLAFIHVWLNWNWIKANIFKRS